MPSLSHLQRIPAVYERRLEHQGIFTTGLLLEVSETPTRKQYLADQIGATPNDVDDWRDEALLLNLARFGAVEQAIFSQAGVLGIRAVVDAPVEEFARRLDLAARTLGLPVPDELTITSWWEQAQTLEEE